ncbi:MAG TPA: DUF2330 domain-containing protein [Actinomycetota bacterium]|nr:DUF2330 domain-containing protein [Actinomycetota bacterium]
MAIKRLATAGLTAAFVTVAGPAWACGGLVGDNGAVSLGRTTTLAAYVDGIEHYITGFEFAGSGGAFGSIVPLPGVPTKVEKAGDWTLQRLQLEVAPPVVAELAASGDAVPTAARAEVVLEAEVDSLDITVLRGGARAVGLWAKDNGFGLSPDAPEILDFYATRSPIFMAVRFDPERTAAQGLALGQATPVHVTIPTENPWIPLRILALGKKAAEPVSADVFLLTEREPALLPNGPAIAPARSEPASASLLQDLAGDDRMGWLPTDGLWFTHLPVDVPAGELRYDLAVDASGAGDPSEVAAGLTVRDIPMRTPEFPVFWFVAGVALMTAGAATVELRRARTAQ